MNKKQEPKHKRNKNQRLQDLVDIATMILKGRTQKQIVNWIALNRPYTLSQQQISHDVKKIKKAWREDCVEAFKTHKETELAKINNLERTYWDCFDRSCNEVTTREIREQLVGPGEGSKSAIVKRIEQIGDPRYLQGVERCRDARTRLLGLSEAIKIETNDMSELSDKELVERYKQKIMDSVVGHDG